MLRIKHLEQGSSFKLRVTSSGSIKESNGIYAPRFGPHVLFQKLLHGFRVKLITESAVKVVERI